MTSMREDAMLYAESKQLPKLLESLLMALLLEKPDDHVRYMIEKLQGLPTGATEIDWKSIHKNLGKSAASDSLDKTDLTTNQKLSGEGQIEDRLIELIGKIPIVLLLGGPGCGKGTQCEMLQRDFNLTHLSTGALLREKLDRFPTDPRSKEMAKIISNGQLIPVEIVSELLFEKMLDEINNHTQGFLIDGYPRNLEQVKLLEDKVGNCNLVVHLKVSEDTMLSRISGRSQYEARSDDKSSNHRIDVYNNETLPVIDHYKSILAEIDGEQDIDSVYKEVRDVVSKCLKEAKVDETDNLPKSEEINVDDEKQQIMIDDEEKAVEPEHVTELEDVKQA